MADSPSARGPTGQGPSGPGPSAHGPSARQAKPAGWPRSLVLNLLIWVGSLFVLGSSVIHFHLWDSYAYRALPTIGPLFLMQSVAGWALGVVTIVASVISTSVGRKLVLVLVETGFAFSTAFGLIISVNFGLFGWKDTMSAPYAGLALAVEFTAGALLLAASLLLGTEWLAERKSHSVAGAPDARPNRNANAGDGPPAPNRPLGSRPAPQP